MPTLHCWSTTKMCLAGIVCGHGRYPDGTKVITSLIREVDWQRRRVVTNSGTVYWLGEIDPDYLAFINGTPSLDHSRQILTDAGYLP